MKRIVSVIVSAFIFATTNIQAFDIGGVENIASSVSNIDIGNIANGLVSDSFNVDNLFNQIDVAKSSAIDSLVSNLLGTAGGGLNIVAGDLLQYCYDYNPSKPTSIDISINVCSMFNGNTFDPCSLAPDLSSLGYTKKSNSSLSIDLAKLKKYCKDIFGEETIKAKINIGLDDKLKSFDLNYQLKTGAFIDGNSTNMNSEITVRVITYDDIKNSRAKKGALWEAVRKNDYETYQLYERAVEGSNSGDAAKIEQAFVNTKYKTIEDYKEDLQELKDTYVVTREQIDLNKLAREARMQFEYVDSQTTDLTEAAHQKNAVMENILKEYEEMLQKYAGIEKARRILLEHRDYVVYPTQDIINAYGSQKNARARAVFLIEKQKTHKASILADVDSEIFKLKEIARVVVQNEMTKSMKFDRKAAYDSILVLIGEK